MTSSNEFVLRSTQQTENSKLDIIMDLSAHAKYVWTQPVLFDHRY